MKPAKQILIIAGAAVILLAIITGLSARRGSSHHAGEPAILRQITDMTGRKVDIPAGPLRVLSLCTSATDTQIRLGAAESLAAIDEYGRIIPGSQNAKVIGKGSAISREQVVAMRINLAFVWWYQDDAAAMLHDLGVEVVRIRSGRASELPATIRLVGGCLNKEEQAGALAQHVESFLSRATMRPGNMPRKVFLELYGPYKTAGRETYTDDLLKLVGADNIAAEAKGSVVLSAEKLAQADPDVLLCVGSQAEADALAKRVGMTDLRAVRQGHVAALDRYWLVAGPNLPESVEQIRTTIEKVGQ